MLHEHIDAERRAHHGHGAAHKAAYKAAGEPDERGIRQAVGGETVKALHENEAGKHGADHELKHLHGCDAQGQRAEHAAGHGPYDQIADILPAACLTVGIGQMHGAEHARKAGDQHGVAGRKHHRHERHGDHDGSYAGGSSDDAAEKPAQSNHETGPDKFHKSPPQKMSSRAQA